MIGLEKLTEELNRSLFIDVGSISEDYIEFGIDSIIVDNETFKEIPIVKSIVSMLKVCNNISNRNLLKQTITFIREFNNNTIGEEKLEKYRNEMRYNHKKREKELSRVLLLLNNYLEEKRSIMLARLFISYINEEINWDEFCEYSEVISRLFLQDIDILKDLYVGKFNDTDNIKDRFRVERLSSLGIVMLSPKSEGLVFGEQTLDRSSVSVSTFGRKFVKITLLNK